MSAKSSMFRVALQFDPAQRCETTTNSRYEIRRALLALNRLANDRTRLLFH